MEPLLSIVIPVRDEARTIAPALSGWTEWMDCEVIVSVDPASSDGSAAMAASVPGVRVVAPGRSGRGPALAAGAEAARGRHLLFLHADSRVAQDAARGALSRLGGRAVAAAFSIHLDSPRQVFRWLEAGINLRSRLFGLPYGDQGLLISREVYRSVGGFRPLPRCEDLDLVLRLRRVGKIVLLRERCTTSTRRWEHDGVAGVTARNLYTLVRFLLTRTVSREGAHEDEQAHDPTRDIRGGDGTAVDRGPVRG
jgi:rSAM/selenodomain-associated transferase 2